MRPRRRVKRLRATTARPTIVRRLSGRGFFVSAGSATTTTASKRRPTLRPLRVALPLLIRKITGMSQAEAEPNPIVHQGRMLPRRTRSAPAAGITGTSGGHHSGMVLPKGASTRLPAGREGEGAGPTGGATGAAGTAGTSGAG